MERKLHWKAASLFVQTCYFIFLFFIFLYSFILIFIFILFSFIFLFFLIHAPHSFLSKYLSLIQNSINTPYIFFHDWYHLNQLAKTNLKVIFLHSYFNVLKISVLFKLKWYLRHDINRKEDKRRRKIAILGIEIFFLFSTFPPI